MKWTETIVQALKNWNTSLIAYVPDISIHEVTRLIDNDPFFHLVSATREEEAIGIAVDHRRAHAARRAFAERNQALYAQHAQLRAHRRAVERAGPFLAHHDVAGLDFG